jgi:signal transduction histidine kinase
VGVLSEALLRRRDPLLAGALLVFAIAELLLHERYQGRPAWPGPASASALEACLLTVPLAWRRSRPLASSLVVLGTVAVWSPMFGAVEATAGFLALLVCVFSGTAYARRPVVVLVAAVGALALHNAADPSVRTVVDWFWSTGFLVVAVLLGGAVRTRQLRISSLEQDAVVRAREYDERVAAATAAERAAISRELHDIVAHAVSVIVVQAQAGARSLADDPDTTRSLLSTIETTGRSALDDLRRLLRLLSEEGASVDPAPGLAAVPALVQRFRETGVDVRLDLPSRLPRLSGAADLAAYRLVQEALTNAVRHAPGAAARVRVSVEGSAVDVAVEDEGTGQVHTRRTDGAGRGLIGMRERVALAGGSLLEVGPSGHGFRVSARLPVEEPVPEPSDPAERMPEPSRDAQTAGSGVTSLGTAREPRG